MIHSLSQFILMCAAATAFAADAERTTTTPKELPESVLHNPDMGWVLYENYPLDQDPHGSSTLVTLPEDEFPDVDAVAIMFSWQDVETRPDEYDFSKVDFAYDYWVKRGKSIQLRMSATTLMWWANRTPPAGMGAPAYVRERLSEHEKQTRELQGVKYETEDVRNSYYRERLQKFLRAIDQHFSDKRPVSLIDLRGFGVWGEWHSGFKYPLLDDRREALKAVIDLWCEAFPNHRLALSASYDPDSQKELYAGSTREFDVKDTEYYEKFIEYSAFDYAMWKPNVTFRRDGCGGAVHSNERQLMELAFVLERGPFMSEFADGYAQSKAGGAEWLEWKVEDALSLHPNYINLLGWQGSDALAFVHERHDLVESGLRRMGYRFVPTRVEFPTTIKNDSSSEFNISWINRGVGRALRDYELLLTLTDVEGNVKATQSAGELPTSVWVAEQRYDTPVRAVFSDLLEGEYVLGIRLVDSKPKRDIQLPLDQRMRDGSYRVGKVKVRAAGASE